MTHGVSRRRTNTRGEFLGVAEGSTREGELTTFHFIART